MVTPTASHPTTPPFLQVAENLFQRRFPESDLPLVVSQLPILDQALFTELVQQAETAVLSQPAYAYNLMLVVDAAAQRSSDPFLRARAAWQLGRIANGWVQPRLAETAVSRARTLFTQLQEPGWLAACDWQLNALPWTRPNFSQATTDLELALAGLLAAGLDDFAPWCRIALAYAYLLTGHFDDCERETAVAQQNFQQTGNQLGLAHCHYNRASALRRQTRFELAAHAFTDALTLFQDSGASIQAAITTTQLGLIKWWSQHDLPAAESKLQQAATQFSAADMPLWLAQCQFGLGQIYQQTGQLAAAGAAMQTARETFARFQLNGLWADSLLESGWLAFYYGQYEVSLDYFQQAETLYTEIGARWQQAIIRLHQGEVYVQRGLYQHALQHLEEAHHRLQALGFPQRIAAVEVRLARLYLQLNNYPRAHAYLDQAIVHHQQSAPTEEYPSGYILRAEILFEEGKEDEAIPFLHNALLAAQKQDDRLQTARAQRLVGQALCALGRFDEALDYLQTAVTHFTAMGMIIDHAACQVDLGRYYRQTNHPAEARAAWESALALTQDTAPELEWQVYGGLAQLAETAADATSALAHYRRAIAALGRMRRTLWQPSVAGAYLARPRSLLDQAVALAVAQGEVEDSLHFIEESKAQTTAYRLAAPAAHDLTPPAELTEMVSEIRWLQKQVSEQVTTSPFGRTTALEIHQQFMQKVRQYDDARSRWERSSRSSTVSRIERDTFDLAQFRQLAGVHHGEKWLAVDYYYNAAHIQGLVLTPTECYAWQVPLTAAIKLALDKCIKGRNGRSLSPRHLSTLGHALLPDSVHERLTPETHLILAPHRQLHRLPWAALPCGEQDRPLVLDCIPAITPSLHNLTLLWQRLKADSHKPGLLVAVADFQGRHKPLTAVLHETASLQELLGANLHLLTGHEATGANWQQLRQEKGLARFAFLHIATHAFADPYSGRLSGIALYDQDLWLDELAQMAPLPPLVVLSACSSLRTLLTFGASS